MKNIIVDASLICSIFSRKDLTDKITKYFFEENCMLFSNKLFEFETYNSLRYYFNDIAKVKFALETIKMFNIEFLDMTEELFIKAIDISAQVNDTVYDASYHALALAYDYEFITLDAKYYNKAKDLGNIRLFE